MSVIFNVSPLLIKTRNSRWAVKYILDACNARLSKWFQDLSVNLHNKVNIQKQQEKWITKILSYVMPSLEPRRDEERYLKSVMELTQGRVKTWYDIKSQTINIYSIFFTNLHFLHKSRYSHLPQWESEVNSCAVFYWVLKLFYGRFRMFEGICCSNFLATFLKKIYFLCSI